MTQYSGWQSPGWSNQNLLVNWDFRNPVNQRGQKAYGQLPQYSIDMWRISADYANVSVEDGYLQLSSNDINGYGGIAQYLEFPPAGEKVTLSVCMRPYTKIGQGSNILADVGSERFQIYTYSFLWDTENIYISIKALEAVIPGEPIADIKAIKLEIGSISTLALDLMQPSDYAAELRKCQRYLQVIKADGILELGNLHTYDIDAGYFSFPLVCTMRIKPTLTGIENLIAIVGRYTTNSIAATGMDHRFYAEGWISGFLQFNNANFVIGENYPLALKECTLFLLFAEL